MIELDPEELEEATRVAQAYTDAFRRADAEAALSLTVLPVVDCIDLGARCGVYIMDKSQFVESVLEHQNEDYTTETTSLTIEPLGRHAALARVEAVVTKPDGRSGEIEWVEFLARTADGWKVWANWLGPYPQGF